MSFVLPRAERKSTGKIDPVLSQYQQYPYPRRPLLARLSRRDLHTINFEALYSEAHSMAAPAGKRPRILVLGCGTFEPCAIAQANPESDILAIDFSQASLDRLKWHLRFHGLTRRVQLERMDIMEMSSAVGKFDLIFATGVFHHLCDPELALKITANILDDHGILRVMYYSSFGRRWVYKIQAMAKNLGIKNPEGLRKIVELFPNSHPLKIHFYMYQDVLNDAGCVDGFLHARDKGLEPIELRKILDRADLRVRSFLMPEGSRPKDFEQIYQKLPLTEQMKFLSLETLDDWQKLQVMDAMGEVESNFKFIATLTERDFQATTSREQQRFRLNPFVDRYRISTVSSPIFRREICLDKVLKFRKKLLLETEWIERIGLAEFRSLREEMVLIYA